MIGIISGTVTAVARELGHWISFGITVRCARRHPKRARAAAASVRAPPPQPCARALMLGVHTPPFLRVQLTLMIVVNMFMYRTMRKRTHKHGRWHRMGPFTLTCLAVRRGRPALARVVVCLCVTTRVRQVPFVMADLLRHVLQDTGVWPENLPGFVRAAPRTCAAAAPVCVSHARRGQPSAQYAHSIPTDEEDITHLSVMGVFFTIVFTCARALYCARAHLE